MKKGCIFLLLFHRITYLFLPLWCKTFLLPVHLLNQKYTLTYASLKSENKRIFWIPGIIVHLTDIFPWKCLAAFRDIHFTAQTCLTTDLRGALQRKKETQSAFFGRCRTNKSSFVAVINVYIIIWFVSYT